MKRRRFPMAGRVPRPARIEAPAPFFLWPAVCMLEACDEAKLLIEAYLASSPDNNRATTFTKRCQRTIRALRFTKAEIRRLARKFGKAHNREYYNA
jgi:hypothetical protein